MARFSASYLWPEPAEGEGQAGIADPAGPLLALSAQLGFQPAGACPTGLAAARVDQSHGQTFRLVFSWARSAATAGRGLEITAELLSNEAMAAGAPRSRACFRAVHAALLHWCPALMVSQADRRPQRDRLAMAGPAPSSRSAKPRRQERVNGEPWLDQAA